MQMISPAVFVPEPTTGATVIVGVAFAIAAVLANSAHMSALALFSAVPMRAYVPPLASPVSVQVGFVAAFPDH
jgi:hypothetical protein